MWNWSDFNMVRVDEPLKNGMCDVCTHCIKEKRTKKCNDILNKQGKFVSCREIRVCQKFTNQVEYR